MRQAGLRPWLQRSVGWWQARRQAGPGPRPERPTVGRWRCRPVAAVGQVDAPERPPRDLEAVGRAIELAEHAGAAARELVAHAVAVPLGDHRGASGATDPVPLAGLGLPDVGPGATGDAGV